MQLVVLAFSLAVFFVVASLLSGYGLREDHRQSRLQAVKNAATGEPRKQSLQARELLAQMKQERKRKARARRVERKSTARTKRDLQTEQLMELAGVNLTLAQFSAMKLLIALGLLAAVYLLGPAMNLSGDMLLLCYAGAMALGLVLPGQLLKSRISKTQEALRNELPDLMDLLSVSVEAGMGFDAALVRLYKKNKTPLMEELMCAQRDILHGISKKNAYAAVASRCGIKELTSFLNAMVQAEEMGVSIRSVLKIQSDSLRDDRRRRAEEKALKAPVTMLIPMVIFIFPVIFIVLLGPAALTMLEVLM